MNTQATGKTIVIDGGKQPQYLCSYAKDLGPRLQYGLYMTNKLYIDVSTSGKA